jgi:hypothetical protein
MRKTPRSVTNSVLGTGEDLCETTQPLERADSLHNYCRAIKIQAFIRNPCQRIREYNKQQPKTPKKNLHHPKSPHQKDQLASKP